MRHTHRMMMTAFAAALLSATALMTAPAAAQSGDLAAYFGFDGLEVIKIGRDAGPAIIADMDRDGRNDVVVVNNRSSRIEIHYQKANASPEDALDQTVRVNEFPDHWRFRREWVSVTHRVSALIAHDFDVDGLVDIIYAGRPAEIVFLRQVEPGVFDVARRHRVKRLEATRDGLAIANLVGDADEELVAIVDGAISIWPMTGSDLGTPIELAAGTDINAFLIDDFNADGLNDLCGLIAEDPAPVRLWLGTSEGHAASLGAQVRFEMPRILDALAFRLPGMDKALLATIERDAKRLVIHEVNAERIEQQGDRDAAIKVYSFTDPDSRDRDHAIVDVDGDGLLDLVATDTEANAVVIYRQVEGKGLLTGEPNPSLSDLTYLVAGDVDDDPEAEIFVLSEDEGVVGRSDVSGQSAPFPSPLSVSAGHTPTAINLVELNDGPRLAIVAKDSRDYVIDLMAMNGETETIELGTLSRSPDTIVALDANQDGLTDLLLFTRDKPMTMLRANPDGEDDAFTLMESDDMGQYGLVKAARADNIAMFDVDGNGHAELLIADKNFVRAVRYVAEPSAGVSPGWQVVRQINAHDPSSELISLAILDDSIVAADKENDRLVLMKKMDDGDWEEAESLTVRGFSSTAIHAGAFGGDGEPGILAVGDDGFAVIRLAGERLALEEFASWRSGDERLFPHEMAAGDVNSDGFQDLVLLDASEQMCEIFSFSESRRLLHALSFQVYESRLFSGGDAREFEPSQVLIRDVTGDGAPDMVLIAHDRVLLYPQMTRAETSANAN